MNYSFKKANIYKIANLIFYILTVLVNVLANAIPINGKTTGEIADSYPNLFTPAPFTFTIWGVIYVNIPFSIYLAWITIATIANITVFLVSIIWNTF